MPSIVENAQAVFDELNKKLTELNPLLDELRLNHSELKSKLETKSTNPEEKNQVEEKLKKINVDIYMLVNDIHAHAMKATETLKRERLAVAREYHRIKAENPNDERLKGLKKISDQLIELSSKIEKIENHASNTLSATMSQVPKQELPHEIQARKEKEAQRIAALPKRKSNLTLGAHRKQSETPPEVAKIIEEVSRDMRNKRWQNLKREFELEKKSANEKPWKKGVIERLKEVHANIKEAFKSPEQKKMDQQKQTALDNLPSPPKDEPKPKF